MRTKPLVLATLLGLASLATASAQVYSVNAVGFVNLTIPTGFSMIGNPLNAPNNTLGGLFTSVPNGTTFYKFVDGSYRSSTFFFGEWDNPAVTLNPGEGGFIRNDSGAPFTITFVGEVMQGDLKINLPAGFSIAASQVPQALVLSDTTPPQNVPNLGFPAADEDTIYFFRNGRYETSTYFFGEWDTPPVPNVGEAFFVRKKTAAEWTRTFSVNQ